MKRIPETFEITFKENPKGGRPISSYNGIIVMPERFWNPPIKKQISVKISALPNGRSGVIYVQESK